MTRFSLVCLVAAATAHAAGGPPGISKVVRAKAAPVEPLQVTVTPVGPTSDEIDAVKARMLANPAVQGALKGARYRLLEMNLLDPEAKSVAGQGPDRYRAVLYDYTHNRALQVDGTLRVGVKSGGAELRVTTIADQPRPSAEEFAAAVDLLAEDPELGPQIRSGALAPYEPMPAVVFGDGAPAERTLNVGLIASSSDGASRSEIVGVDMVREKVVRFPGGAPRTSLAAAASCGPPAMATAYNPNVNSYQVVVTRGTTEIWRMTVTRPAVSSGTSGGSAIEFTNVDYRGKRVLGRAHTPILNVKYNGDSCGPYRDWQNAETYFTANGTDVPSPNSGIRQCTSPPQTILETGSDAGNFRGVAYYVDTNSVLFVTELTAGWYRYVATWTFLDDGTIKPRFGFGATQNSCVCNLHFHHVYFRFDFDVAGAANNVVLESNQSGSWTALPTETWGRRERLGAKQWLVQNSVTRDAYRVVPGPWDSTADTYGVGDYWFLRNKGSAEYADGGCFSCGGGTEVRLNTYVGGESIQNQDVVMWYGAHFVHNFNDFFGNSAYVGPDLVVSSW